MSHRLELAFSDAVSQNNLARKVGDHLSGLYSFYYKSCVNRDTLRKVFEETGVKQLMHRRVEGTLWVSNFLLALENFFERLQGTCAPPSAVIVG